MTPESTPATERETVEGLMALLFEYGKCRVDVERNGYASDHRACNKSIDDVRAYAERLASPAAVVPPPGYAAVPSLSAAPVAPGQQEALQMIVDMCGWYEHGATEPTGQFEGLSWESIARRAMDIARAALRATKGTAT